jgi:hypothetical protein
VTGDADDRELTRTPSGYRLVFPDIGLTIDARQVRWEHGSLYGVVSVRARMAGLKAVTGDTISESRVNLSSDRGRGDIAKALEARGPGIDLDWRGFLEEFAIRILAAEREGRPFTEVGSRRCCPRAGSRSSSGRAAPPRATWSRRCASRSRPVPSSCPASRPAEAARCTSTGSRTSGTSTIA